MEEWRAVLNFPNYEVSSLGRVRRIAHQTERWRKGKRDILTYPARMMKLHLRGNGNYLGVVFSGPNRSRIKKLVHNLVCEAFHGPRPDGKFALHKDDDATNAREDNLYWGTSQENGLDRIANGGAARGGEKIAGDNHYLRQRKHALHE